MENDAAATDAQSGADEKPEKVVLTIAEQRSPGMLERRMAEAAEAGIPFEVERPETHAEKSFREYGERMAGLQSTIRADDHRAFLASLDKIAVGKVNVI